MNLYNIIKVLHILAVTAVISGVVGWALIRARLVRLDDIYIVREFVVLEGHARPMVGHIWVEHNATDGSAADLVRSLATPYCRSTYLDARRRGSLPDNHSPRHLGLHSSWQDLWRGLSEGTRTGARDSQVAWGILRPGDSRLLAL